MTPLLYYSMLCHLQLHTALAHYPSPSEDVVLLFAPEEINMFKNNKQTKKYLLQKYFLMIREALDCSEQPGDEASVVHRSDDEVYILLEMAST